MTIDTFEITTTRMKQKLDYAHIEDWMGTCPRTRDRLDLLQRWRAASRKYKTAERRPDYHGLQNEEIYE